MNHAAGRDTSAGRSTVGSKHVANLSEQAQAILRAWTAEREMLLQPLYDQINELRGMAAKLMDTAIGSDPHVGAMSAAEAYGVELSATALVNALRKVEDRLGARMIAEGDSATAPARLPDAWAGTDLDDEAFTVGVLHDAQVTPGSVNPMAWPYVARLLRAATRQLFGTPLGLKAAGQVARAMTSAFMGERELRQAMDDEAFTSHLLDLCGFVDGGEVSADGSADNDLAHERREAAEQLISMVRQSGWPQAIVDAARAADRTPVVDRDDT